MREITEVEVAAISGAGFWSDVGEKAGEAYAWYEANIEAIHAGNLTKSRM